MKSKAHSGEDARREAQRAANLSGATETREGERHVGGRDEPSEEAGQRIALARVRPSVAPCIRRSSGRRRRARAPTASSDGRRPMVRTGPSGRERRMTTAITAKRTPARISGSSMRETSAWSRGFSTSSRLVSATMPLDEREVAKARKDACRARDYRRGFGGALDVAGARARVGGDDQAHQPTEQHHGEREQRDGAEPARDARQARRSA